MPPSLRENTSSRLFKNLTPAKGLFRTLALTLLCSSSLALALGGQGAAPINPATISITLHVDAAAPGPGDGSASDPFNDLQQAINRAVNQYNAAGTGVRVLLTAGTYRVGDEGATSALNLPSPSTDAPVVIEGAGWSPGTHTGDVIITGSDVWTSWTDAGDGTWTRAWPYAWGVGPNNTGGGNPPEAMLRYEHIHVNGTTYYQMLGPDDPNRAHLTSEEGAFWVNESSGILTIKPPDSFGDLNAALVEVTTKRRLLHHWPGAFHLN